MIRTIRENAALLVLSLALESAMATLSLAEEPDLHRAARAGALDKIEGLLRGHADINAKDDAGRTPLALALQLGQRSAAKLLLAKDAAVDLTKDTTYIDDDLAPYFRATLLKKQLVWLDSGEPRSSATQFLAELARNQLAPPTGSIWTYPCDNCPHYDTSPRNLSISAAICAYGGPDHSGERQSTSNVQWIFNSDRKFGPIHNTGSDQSDYAALGGSSTE